jgi:hypothetical protein
MDEREDLQNIEDNIVAENIDTSLEDNIVAQNIDSSIEEQIKTPPIEIEKLKEEPFVPEYSEFPVEPLPEGLTYKAPKKEAPKKEINIPTGPVQLQADGFYLLGNLGERLYKKATDQEVDQPQSDYSIIETATAGIIDARLKMVRKFFFSLTGEIVDAVRSDGVAVDKGTAAKFEKYFDDSVFGKVQKGAEEIAYTDAVGILVSGLSQLYGGAKLATGTSLKIAEKAKSIANKYISAAKVNRIVKPNQNMVLAMDKADKLNKLTRTQKYFAIGVGGGIGAGLVADAEQIGTLGDIEILEELFGNIPSKLDRAKRDDAKEEAVRNLTNRFKFGADTGLIGIVTSYGLGAIGKKLSKQGEDLARSNDKLDQWIDKFAKAFRPRGTKPEKLFQGIKDVEGQINSGQLVAKDLILDIDKTLFNIAKESGISTKTPAFKKIVEKVDDLLTASDDVVKGGKITFKGFDAKTTKEFRQFGKEVGLTNSQTDNIFSDLIKVRNEFNVFKNALLTSKNLNVGTKEFNKIMSERSKNIFSSEYKIATDRSMIPWVNYKPSIDNVNAVKGTLDRYAKSNKVKLSDADLDSRVDDIIKNVKINELTNTPEFYLTKSSLLDDGQTQLINIANNIKGKKFVPNELIKTPADLKNFQRLFGQKKDVRNSIINTINDLSSLVAKDKFYSNIDELSQRLIKEGKPSIVYPTRSEALKNLKNQNIITNPNGLQIKSPLGEEAYTNPLNRKFTSVDFAEALKFAEKIPFEGLTKNAFYRHLVLIPKGMTQASKTILNPFTQIKNFTTSSVFTIGTGNAFKDPRKLVANFKQAFNTIQPQLASKETLRGKIATLGLSYRNAPKDQAIYRFLLEENVVSSSPSAKDVIGTIDDIGKGGDIYVKFFGKFGEMMKKGYEVAESTYVAGDDFYKIYNFLAEFDTYKNAYTKAAKSGLIKSVPSDLQISKEAAKIVRDTYPNYAYVGEFVQALRRTPLGDFMAWPISVIRSGANTIELALKEIANPVLRTQGYKRLISFGTTTAVVVPTITEIGRNLYGITKDQVAAARVFVPEFSKESILFVYRDDKGELKYVDGSGAFVYDTFTSPITSVIAGIDEKRVFDPNSSLVKGLYSGLAKGISKFASTFIEPSIYYSIILDVFARDGQTREGNRIWNPGAPLGEKLSKAAIYGLEKTAPFGIQQFKRLGQAALDIPGPRGEKYEVSDEIAGFYGLRGVKLNPIEKMDFKINDFKREVGQSRSLLTSEVLKGGQISRDDIINRYILANEQKFKAMKRAKQVLDAAELLGADEKELAAKYKENRELNAFNYLKRAEFKPFDISPATKEKIIKQREKLESEFDELEFLAPLDSDVVRTLNEIKRDMLRMPLDGRFKDYIDPKNYLFNERSEGPSNVQPLPPQPMPNQQVVQQPQPSAMQNGLTPTESALLNESEKVLRLKQRGLA